MQNLTSYRWLFMVIVCFINLCTGSVFSWSVFAGPKAAQLTEITGQLVTAADLALVFSLANSVGPIPMFLGGYINDKIGPRWVIVLGGIMMGAGMVWAGLAQSFAELFWSYGLLYGLGLGCVYNTTINNSIKFFPDHRGLAGGLATSSYGLCSVLLPPIAYRLIKTSGITSAFEIVGIVCATVVIIGGLMCKKCPDGFMPEGFKMPVRNQSGQKNFNTFQMVRCSQFWAMLFFLTCGAAAGMMIISHAAGIAQHQFHFTAADAAIAVSFLALVNTGGRLVAGLISDKLGSLNTLRSACVITAAGLCALYFLTELGAVALYGGLLCIGLSFGAFMSVFPGYTAETFGTRYNSANYGVMFIGFALSGGLAPWMMTALSSTAFGMTAAYLVAIFIAIFGLLLTFTFKSVH